MYRILTVGDRIFLVKDSILIAVKKHSGVETYSAGVTKISDLGYHKDCKELTIGSLLLFSEYKSIKPQWQVFLKPHLKAACEQVLRDV